MADNTQQFHVSPLRIRCVFVAKEEDEMEGKKGSKVLQKGYDVYRKQYADELIMFNKRKTLERNV